MFPIFFSVSDKDVALAERIWDRFPSHLIYLYSRNGAVGADMWEEISERELPSSKGIVIFWSRNYLSSTGTRREILQASKLFRDGVLNNILVVRLDDLPIISSVATDEDKPIFEALRPLLKFRTTPEGMGGKELEAFIERFVETVLPSEHPKLPRADLLDDFRNRSRKDRLTTYPAMWVSGLNGVGRFTTILEANQYFAPSGLMFPVDINEASTPKQLLLRLSDDALGLGLEALERLQATVEEDAIAPLRELIEQVALAGHSVVFRQARIVDESVDLPEWLDELALSLEVGTRPKLFLVTQIPLTAIRRSHLKERLNDIRVTTVDEHVLIEYAWQLVGHFDRHPRRWTEDVVQRVVVASAGTLGLLITIMRTAASLEDLAEVDSFAGQENERIATSLTAYARWAFSRLADDVDAQRALTFLNDVSPCDAEDLATVLSSARPISSILGSLLALGLVERDSTGLYRLTPLLSNRLSRDLITPSLLEWQNSVLRTFASTPIDFATGENDYVKIEARLQASFWTEKDDIPTVIRQFQSAAHWFQAGIRLYNAKRYAGAYRVLQKAFNARASFSDVTRMEVVRYYALSAVRFREFGEVEKCIAILNGDHRSHDIAAFVEGYAEESKGHFYEAIRFYDEALQGAIKSKNERRLERIYRPLINCILRTPNPNYAQAEKYAKKNLEVRKTLFSLTILARVYLEWLYSGSISEGDGRTQIEQRYGAALEMLRKEVGALAAYHEIKAEEFVLDGKVRQAKEEFDVALGIGEPRFELRLRRWEVMVGSGEADILDEAIHEFLRVKSDARYRPYWEIFAERITFFYARALRATGTFDARKIEQFASGLSQSVRGRIIAQSR